MAPPFPEAHFVRAGTGLRAGAAAPRSATSTAVAPAKTRIPGTPRMGRTAAARKLFTNPAALVCSIASPPIRIFEGWRHGARSPLGQTVNIENQGDLPVMQPSRFEFVVNLKTA